MKLDPACLPCALNRALCTAQKITSDPWLHHQLLANAMQELLDGRRDVTPAEMVFSLEGVISKTLGAADPYQKIRADWHEELDGLLEKLSARIADGAQPLHTALAMAARANVFDDEQLSPRQVRDELKRLALAEGAAADRFAHDDIVAFEKELGSARTLMFLHDSGPEAPFDRELVKQVVARQPSLAVTCVVRPKPVLLDATREDLERYRFEKLDGVAGIIDAGIAALGVPLNECSREFRERFEAADVIIAKGQAHYETLEDCGRTVFFLLRVKCPVMARKQASKVGDIVFVKS